MNFFSANKLFYSSQYEFRKGRSTDLASIELVDRVFFNTWIVETYQSPIFLSMLNHPFLLNELKYYDFSFTPLNLFASYVKKVCNMSIFTKLYQTLSL